MNPCPVWHFTQFTAFLETSNTKLQSDEISCHHKGSKTLNSCCLFDQFQLTSVVFLRINRLQSISVISKRLIWFFSLNLFVSLKGIQRPQSWESTCVIRAFILSIEFLSFSKECRVAWYLVFSRGHASMSRGDSISLHFTGVTSKTLTKALILQCLRGYENCK